MGIVRKGGTQSVADLMSGFKLQGVPVGSRTLFTADKLTGDDPVVEAAVPERKQRKAPEVKARVEKEIEMAEVEKVGKAKPWGVRLDEALLDLVKRNSGNQAKDAEMMIMDFALKMGWK